MSPTLSTKATNRTEYVITWAGKRRHRPAKPDAAHHFAPLTVCGVEWCLCPEGQEHDWPVCKRCER